MAAITSIIKAHEVKKKLPANIQYLKMTRSPPNLVQLYSQGMLVQRYNVYAYTPTAIKPLLCIVIDHKDVEAPHTVAELEHAITTMLHLKCIRKGWTLPEVPTYWWGDKAKQGGNKPLQWQHYLLGEGT